MFYLNKLEWIVKVGKYGNLVCRGYLDLKSVWGSWGKCVLNLCDIIIMKLRIYCLNYLYKVIMCFSVILYKFYCRVVLRINWKGMFFVNIFIEFLFIIVNLKC